MVHSEPYGSVFARSAGCLVRGPLGRHAPWRARAARTWRRVDHGSGPDVPHDPDGHAEARRRPGAGRARYHGEGRAGSDVPTRSAPTRGRDGMDRAAAPAVGRTLRRVGEGRRRTTTEGAG